MVPLCSYFVDGKDILRNKDTLFCGTFLLFVLPIGILGLLLERFEMFFSLIYIQKRTIF